MFRRTLFLLAALAALSGCGADNPRFIPGGEADALTARIDEAARAAEDGECDEARTALRDAERQVRDLSPKVAVRLRRNLGQWVDALQDRLSDGCEPEPTPEPSPSPTEAPTEEPTEEPEPTTAPTVAPTPPPEETPVPQVTVEPGSGGAVPPEDEE